MSIKYRMIWHKDSESDEFKVYSRELAAVVGQRNDLLAALKDCVESLSRLPSGEGAYRVTCLAQAQAAIARATQDTQAQEKRDSGHPGAGTGQSESKPN